ncbi:cyclase family protein [Methanospirillum purgamenti]|uniref:Cyclase family protein n=1 Tax=Methanospirillum hungatei TaxID=2203 RepID=A0A8F5VKD8_METHU|nr:cyclase family protein [Methanospirillum hungatei]QXO94637.1 cyclase family protein [Methanospirillum hungatei]
MSIWKYGIFLVCLCSFFLISLPVLAVDPGSGNLTQIWQQMQDYRFVDLTHTFEPGIPHWKGDPDETVETLYSYEPGNGTLGSGFYMQYYCHVGQWGTHVDPPAHFIKGLRTLDQISPREMILPLVVIDIHEKVYQNPDYVVTIDDVKDWEEKNGQIPEGSFVALRTDWSKHWPDQDEMQNTDSFGVAHYPGWSQEVLTYLYEQRNITASGHETTDTDPGIVVSQDKYPLETYILSQNKYQVELLTNLDQVSEVGALIVVAFPKPLDGSGFPARVFAICP